MKYWGWVQFVGGGQFTPLEPERGSRGFEYMTFEVATPEEAAAKLYEEHRKVVAERMTKAAAPGARLEDIFLMKMSVQEIHFIAVVEDGIYVVQPIKNPEWNVEYASWRQQIIEKWG